MLSMSINNAEFLVKTCHSVRKTVEVSSVCSHFSNKQANTSENLHQALHFAFTMKMLVMLTGLLVVMKIVDGVESPMGSGIMGQVLETLAQRHRPPTRHGGFSSEKQKTLKGDNKHSKYNYGQKQSDMLQDLDSNKNTEETRPELNNQQSKYLMVQELENRPNYLGDYAEPDASQGVVIESADAQQKFCSFGKPEVPNPTHSSLPFLPVIIYNMGPINHAGHQPAATLQNLDPSIISSLLASVPVGTPTSYLRESLHSGAPVTEVRDDVEDIQSKQPNAFISLREESLSVQPTISPTEARI